MDECRAGPGGFGGESEGAGYAVVTKGLYAEQQVQSGASGAYGDPGLSGTVLSGKQ